MKGRPYTALRRPKNKTAPHMFSTTGRKTATGTKEGSPNEKVIRSRSQKPHVLPPGVEQPQISTDKQTPHVNKRNKDTQNKIVITQTDQKLDTFLQLADNNPLHECLEIFFKNHFYARNVFYWEDIPSLSLLFSRTNKNTVPHLTGLVGYSFFSGTLVNTKNAPAHPSFHAQADGKYCPLNAPALIFPLQNHKNVSIGIVEIIRPINGEEFTQDDVEFINWFTKKFKMLSKWIIRKPKLNKLILSILKISNTDKFLIDGRKAIADFFNARTFEIWRTYPSGELIRFTSKPLEIDPKKCGVAGSATQRGVLVNALNTRLESSYCENVDGFEDHCILCVPVKEDNSTWCFVLRAPMSGQLFPPETEYLVQQLSPAIILAMKNSEAVTKFEKELAEGHRERAGLQTILNSAQEISAHLDVKKVIEAIIESGRRLTKADRCALFIVNEARDRLTTYMQTGLDEPIDIPIYRGVAGHTVREGKELIIDDAYSCDYFDRQTDEDTGYKTHNILSAPIFNAHSEVIGVTQMVNKEGSFDAGDAKIIKLFNIFCGTALENAKLYKESLDVSSKLRGVFEASFALSKGESISRLLTDIIGNARNSIGCERASLFVIDDNEKQLKSVVFDGLDHPMTLPLNAGIIGHCVKSREPAIVNNAYADSRFNQSVDEMTGYKTQSILAVPVINNERVVGAVEMVNKADGRFNKADAHALQSFATFAAIAMQTDRMKELASTNPDLALSSYIKPEEMNSCETPERLKLGEVTRKKLLSLNNFAKDYSPDDLVRSLFFFFDHFGVRKEFNITNELLFRFIFTIRGKYNPVPYHNWIHACDATQYVCYELETSGLGAILTPLEKLAMIVAAICHDANHNGFNNVFNEKAELPLGIVFQGQSVLETYHITVAVGVLSQDQTNIFHALDTEQQKRIWHTIISLIKATDMAQHFKIVKEASDILDSGEFSIDKEEHRLLAMRLLMKIADISNVSRPFKIADAWCDILNEEFFRQGDNEKKLGIGLTSNLNDRENSDKPKSQIGFYNFICIPLYQVVARMFPPLTANLDSVKSNLEVWKAKGAVSAPKEEEKK